MAWILSFVAAAFVVLIAATALNWLFDVDYFYNTIFFVLMALGLSDVFHRLLKSRLTD